MDWTSIGLRIRRQREFIGYTREQFAELIGITPKFCSDIELGIKGMSIPTLLRIASVLKLSTDYILYGTSEEADSTPISRMLQQCTPVQRHYAEEILKNYLLALDSPGK